MKKKYILFAAFASMMAFTSCDTFLDKLPDDRAEVDTEKDVTDLLVSAYPDHVSDYLLEMSSDNVEDNGVKYNFFPSQDRMYKWEKIDTENNDDPYWLWRSYYKSVATANEALDAIKRMGSPKSMDHLRAEGLLCRAFSMYQLANVFCMAYDPTKADKYMGLPYPKEPAKELVVSGERGTLKQLYENINADIEEALPMMDDSYLKTPKYHFNMKAAYSFAARFNLMCHNYDKAIEYATAVLGKNPIEMMRNQEQYVKMSPKDINNAYVRENQNVNLLLLPAYSIYGRIIWGDAQRFSLNIPLTNYELFWAKTPWSPNSASYGNNCLYMAKKLYGTDEYIFYPKHLEFWEVTNKINNTGFAHTVSVAFSGDETLLVRAEAYALKKDYQNALKDMNVWVTSYCMPVDGKAHRPLLTAELIDEFYKTMPYSPATPQTDLERTIRKKLNPQGFTVEKGTQENMIQLILHMRRLTTVFDGLRFIDLKRYGIEYTHFLSGQEPLVFKAGDLRGALQLPPAIISAGVVANPR